ncbi:MAG: hypothetical protein JW787_05070 [Sedimentisphaerales bacterium]|nr:hypothetical protein [Sedimentisphaerales bacterium]
MKKSLLLQIFLWEVIFFQTVSGTNSGEDEEYDLTLKINCPVKNLQVGDEIPIVFTITNNDSLDYQYINRNYDRSGRIMEYQLLAQKKDGGKVPDPRENVQPGIGGGLSGEAIISKGQSFNVTVALNRWALIKKPGKYTVTGIYTYSIEDKNARTIPDTITMKTIEVKSKPIEIEIKYRSSKQMGKYIESLQKELKQYPASNDWEIQKKRETIILKLDYTCDKRIIPTLVDLIYLNQHNNDVFWAMEGFRCYLPKTPEIRNQLLDTLRKRGFEGGIASVLESYNCDESIFKEILIKALNSDNPDIILDAVLIAQNHPSNEITPLVIAVAKGRTPNNPKVSISQIARERAMYALAHNRTDEVVEALNELKNDPNNRINKAAHSAIEQAYTIHPIYPEKTDEEYTAMLIPIAMNPNHPYRMALTMEILRTRTEEGVEAIKKLLENPELNIPIVETDSGVKAIRDLLRSPDKKQRTIIAEHIEFTYKTKPGRAFKKDDFPDEFQERLEKRKSGIIERIKSWEN